jgi:hypothetical protein
MMTIKEKTTKENSNQKRKYKRKKEKNVYVISTYIHTAYKVAITHNFTHSL